MSIHIADEVSGSSRNGSDHSFIHSGTTGSGYFIVQFRSSSSTRISGSVKTSREWHSNSEAIHGGRNNARSYRGVSCFDSIHWDVTHE